MIPLSVHAESTISDIRRVEAASTENQVLEAMRFVYLASLAEAFLDEWIGQLTGVVEMGARVNSELVSSVLSDFFDDSIRSWDRRRDAVGGLSGVRIGELSTWQVIGGLIEARNSIVHGGGRLTRFQLRSPRSAEGKLKQARFRLVSGDLVTGVDTWQHCVNATVAFVRECDSVLSESYRKHQAVLAM